MQIHFAIMLLGCHACTLLGRYRTSEDLAALPPAPRPHPLTFYRPEDWSRKALRQFGTHVTTKIHGVTSRGHGNLDSQGRRTLKSYFI